MTTDEMRMRNIMDFESSMLRVVLLLELVQPVRSVQVLKLIPFGGFYISSLLYGSLLMTPVTWKYPGLFLQFLFIKCNGCQKF